MYKAFIGMVSRSSMSFNSTDLSHLDTLYFRVFCHGCGRMLRECRSERLVFSLYSCIFDLTTSSIIIALGEFDCLAIEREFNGVAMGCSWSRLGAISGCVKHCLPISIPSTCMFFDVLILCSHNKLKLWVLKNFLMTCPLKRLLFNAVAPMKLFSLISVEVNDGE